MTLSDLGNVGEFVGSIGVIVSLIYVGMQLKMTRQSERATSAWQCEKLWGELSWELSTDPELARLMANLLSGEKISDSEMPQVHFFIRALMQHAQSQYYLNQEGILPNEIWSRRLSWLRQFVSISEVAQIVESEKAQRIFTDDFWDKVQRRDERFDISVGPLTNAQKNE